jgi:mannose-6-phosphate isomerase-like protein (cupin superfamily)
MSANATARVLLLITAIQSALGRRPPAADAVDRELASVLSALEPLPPLTGQFPRNRHAATRHLPAAFQAGNGSTAGLLDAIKPVARQLPWRYRYPPRADAPGLGREIAFAEIIGPEAPYRSDSLCLGLTLIGPETLYPAHRHPAVELYLVLAGSATWTLDGVSREHPPGAFILHPSQAVHAMQTYAEPLLAIYTWTGPDVHTLSVYTPSAGTEGFQSTP